MKQYQALAFASAAVLALSMPPAIAQPAPAAPASPATSAPAGAVTAAIPAGTRSHADLVTLFTQFADWKNPVAANGVVDYSPATVERRRQRLRQFQAQLPDFAVSGWDRHHQVDYLAVRAQMDQHDFLLNVTKPWARDPGLYVDDVQRVAYADLPLKGDELATLRTRLRGIPAYLKQAQVNLDSVAADYADLAIHALSNGDGVGHGMPYRAVEPAGAIGWYDDLLARARTQQPALVPEITAARTAITGFRDWLTTNRPRMTAKAGVGKPAYDWFLRNVRLMPYSSDDIVDLGQRELERQWAFYGLERHRNRRLPELQLPKTKEEYETQLAGTDAMIRKWLVDEEFITIPDYIPKTWDQMGFNAPWVVRPKGPMFWEQVMYRDVSPDHVHATIPGHRFDGHIGRRVTHPIRGRISDSGRTEGYAFYLEETALQLGMFDDRPRTRELMYIFGIFRAVRTIGDVLMQRNEMTVDQTMNYWKEWTPYLDDDVARVDAGIYLRRPPGYGMTYTVGMMQLQKMLVDRKRQLGEKFVLKDFHDYLMNTGRLPVALLHYDLTGNDEVVQDLWAHTPLAQALTDN